MVQRDKGRVVLAEDEPDRALEMRKILEKVGNYEVWVTKRKAEILELVEETNSLWVILDLNLKDGNSGEMVPALRKRYGKNVVIIILSGYYEEFPEFELLAKGADLYLRKPYEPKALLQQMDILLARMEGKELREGGGLMLEFGGGSLDLDRGLYKKGRDEVMIPGLPLKMVKRLAAERGEEAWEFVDRSQLVTDLWAMNFEKDPEGASDKIRKVRARIREVFGTEIVDCRTDGVHRAPRYRLSENVKLVG